MVVWGDKRGVVRKAEVGFDCRLGRRCAAVQVSDGLVDKLDNLRMADLSKTPAEC